MPAVGRMSASDVSAARGRKVADCTTSATICIATQARMKYQKRSRPTRPLVSK